MNRLILWLEGGELKELSDTISPTCARSTYWITLIAGSLLVLWLAASLVWLLWRSVMGDLSPVDYGTSVWSLGGILFLSGMVIVFACSRRLKRSQIRKWGES